MFDCSALAAKITEAVFWFDPYNGADKEDMTKANKHSLSTIEGCYEIIDGLCEMLLQDA